MRQANHRSDSEDSNDPTAGANGTDSQKAKRMLELEQKLEKLYSSMDTNNGVLEDIYLIPLLNEQILNSFSHKRGYVLDGYPTTVEQAKQLFSGPNVPQQININRLPDLTVCLKQNPLLDSRELSDITTEILPAVTKNMKKRLKFSEIKVPSNLISAVKPDLSIVKSVKPILKKTSDFSVNTKLFTGKTERLIWNQRNYNNLLIMLNSNYVQMITVDSPYSLLELDVNKVEQSEINLIFEKSLNIVVQEFEWSQNHTLLENLDKTNSMATKLSVNKFNAKHVGEELKKKMTLLEEFENIITYFEHIENLSTEEYLMKYVTPTLTKLITQVAKVRPKHPVDFLASMALKENPEGLFGCPGYSKKGKDIQTLLECMFQNITSHDQETSFDLKPLITSLTTYVDEESVISQE